MTVRETITENSKQMSELYLVAALDAAACSRGRTLNGDLRLERMSEVLAVVARHNCTEQVLQRQQKIEALNTFRNMVSYKPRGFDQIVDEMGSEFFFTILDAGLGRAQLASVAYLIPIDLLQMYEILNLRESSLKAVSRE